MKNNKMKKRITLIDLLKDIFLKYNSYELYNYMNMSFNDDVMRLELDPNEEDVVDYLLEVLWFRFRLLW